MCILCNGLQHGSDEGMGAYMAPNGTLDTSAARRCIWLQILYDSLQRSANYLTTLQRSSNGCRPVQTTAIPKSKLNIVQ